MFGQLEANLAPREDTGEAGDADMERRMTDRLEGFMAGAFAAEGPPEDTGPPVDDDEDDEDA